MPDPLPIGHHREYPIPSPIPAPHPPHPPLILCLPVQTTPQTLQWQILRLTPILLVFALTSRELSMFWTCSNCHLNHSRRVNHSTCPGVFSFAFKDTMFLTQMTRDMDKVVTLLALRLKRFKQRSWPMDQWKVPSLCTLTSQATRVVNDAFLLAPLRCLY